MADDDRWVVLAALHNPVQLEMWRDLLKQEGIPAQIPGQRHGQLLGGASVGIEVRVRAADEARARELLETLELGEPIERADDEGDSEPPPSLAGGEGKGPYRGDARSAVRSLQRKSPLVSTAVGLLLTFGTAHFYAGELLSGLVLAATQILAFLVLVGGQLAGAILLVLVIGIDIASGVRAVRRANEGKRFPPLTQLGRILPLVLGAALFAALFLHNGGSR